MARFVDEAKTAIQSAACAVLSANEFVNGAVGLVSPGTRDAFNGAVNATRRLIGCTAPDPEPPDPGFTGGQCPGSRYLAAADFNFGSGTTRSTFSSILFGPVSFSTAPTSVPGQFDVFVTDRDGTYGWATGTTEFSAIDVSPFGGDPDDCGDPPPVYPPPIDIDIDIDVDYDDDDGNPISVTIPVVFAPITVNFDGSLEVPFSFDFGGITFDGSLDLSPEVNVDINLPRLPRGTGSGAEEISPGDPEDDVPPDESQQKIIGLVVTAQVESSNAATAVDAESIPTIFVPRLGSVKFAYSFGGATFWSSDIDVKGLREFIPCPFDQGADFSSASPVPGVTLSVVQIRGYPAATVEDVRRAA